MLPTQTDFITRNQFQNENNRQSIKTFFRRFKKKSLQVTTCDYKIHIHFFSPRTGKKSIKKNGQDKTQRGGVNVIYGWEKN